MDPALPAGLRYVPDFVDAHEETGLLEVLEAMAFSEVAMRCHDTRRRVTYFGSRYG